MTNNDWKKKLTSPEEAVKLVHDHDRIFIGFVSNITPVLSDALWERRQELNDITIISGLLLRPTRLYTEPTENRKNGHENWPTFCIYIAAPEPG